MFLFNIKENSKGLDQLLGIADTRSDAVRKVTIL